MLFLLVSLLLGCACAQESGRLILSYALSNEIRISGDASLPLIISFYIPGETVAIGQVVLAVDRASSFV